MRWPWARRRPTDIHGGQKAREQAERDLERTRAETPYYADLGAQHRWLREKNHWGETIAAIARKERPT